MQITTNLIVTLMFTSIVGIGIGNILMRFAAASSRMELRDLGTLEAWWLIILLLAYLSMFWNASLIFSYQAWSFALFLYALVGPGALLMASNMMCELFSSDAEGGGRVDIHKRVFFVFAASQVWMVGMDFIVGSGWVLRTSVSLGLAAASVALALAGSQRQRAVFTGLILAASLLDIIGQTTAA